MTEKKLQLNEDAAKGDLKSQRGSRLAFCSLGISDKCKQPMARGLARALELMLERVLSLRNLDAVYQEIERRPEEDSLDTLVSLMGFSYTIERGELSRIPASGPVIVVANHPFGGAEAVLLAKIMRSVRNDSKVMANSVISRFGKSSQYCIYVDPFGSRESLRRNIGPLRESVAWVKAGGALGAFPSGAVSHLQLRKREVSDPEWSTTIARMVRQTRAQVVPVHFHGRNGPLFQLAGLIHPMLRTMLIPREFYGRRNSVLRVSIGTAIPHEKLASFSTDQEMIEYLRLRSYILGSTENEQEGRVFRPRSRRAQRQIKLQPIVAPEDPKLLEVEIERIPRQQILLKNGPYTVLYAKAKQIPHVLIEIGRLREVTFRRAQEGTGRSIDLDNFDNFYTHLFVWNTEKKEIVGAYRLVKSDYVLSRYGKRGFYTFTLFSYKTSLLRQLGPAIELGRSFIRPEYQKDFSPLLLLWRGIGRYVARNPEYRALFGPVSINSEYDRVSRYLIKTFLEVNSFLPRLGRIVKPRNPMPRTNIRGVKDEPARVVKDMNDVSELLQEMEGKHQSVPVLLRQYLKLGAKLLAFNIDPNFGDVLDGLIYVDLNETEPRLLERYMGKEEAKRFLEYQASDRSRFVVRDEN